MAETSRSEDIHEARIMLGLLASVEQDGAQSQRRLASELGIALGLVNAYLKRCVKKGLVKASQAPARRYVYYLTPQGFAEKSRLTVEYARQSSFGFFRQAKEDCRALFQEAHRRGLDRLVLMGRSDLAEIAAICALESGITIVATVDPAAGADGRFVGLPLVRNVAELGERPAAAVVTDLLRPHETSEHTIALFGEDRVFIPELLRIRLRQRREVNA
jgi:DNA-binding MarR family transcriptional regulator